MLEKKDWSVYYKELKSIPSTIKLMFLGTGIIIANAILVFIFNTKSMILFISFIALILLFSLLPKKLLPQISLKRMFALQTFYLGGLLVSLMIKSLTPFYGVYFADALVVTFAVLSYTVFMFTTHSSRLISFLAFLPLNILNLLFYATINYNDIMKILNFFYKIYIINISVLIITLLYIKYIGFLSKKKYNFDAIMHFKGFLLTWLSKNNIFYEKVLNNEKLLIKSFDISLIKIRQDNSKSNSNEVIMLDLPIHPGPFLNVGSSDLPTELLNKKEINIMPFHGLTTHYFDLPLSSDKNELINLIVQKSKQIYANKPVLSSSIIEKSIEDMRIAAFRLNNLVIAVIEAEKEGIIDDIPPKIREEASKIAKSYGFVDVFIIDAHNSDGETSKAKTDAKKIEVLLEVLRELISKLRDEKIYETKIGISEFELPNEFRKESTGKGKVITFLVNGYSYAFVLIDSNNIVLSLRKTIEKRLSGIFNRTFICSTDSHVLTASFSGVNSYYPLGHDKKNWELLCEIILNSVKEALENSSNCYFGYSKIVTRKFRILGNLPEIYEKATLDLIKYGKIMPYLLYLITIAIIFSVYPLL